MESMILEVTEIAKPEWGELLRQLEAAALVEAEDLPGVTVPFLRFHPTLAPMLLDQVTPDERGRLNRAHREGYHAFANYLYTEDRRNPHQARAIASRELPNVLHAVHASLAVGDPGAIDFVDTINRFLSSFGLRREMMALAAQAQAFAGEPGSESWYVVQENRGDQLLESGRPEEAAEVFQRVLERLSENPSHDRAMTLGRLGRCYKAGGRPDLAERKYREGVAMLDRLELGEDFRSNRSTLLTELGDVLAGQGRYAEARKFYGEGLEGKRQLKDLRGQGISHLQLGTLALREGKLEEALSRYHDALALRGTGKSC
jgi:tetratricopeptide (TPR) repeat protein